MRAIVRSYKQQSIVQLFAFRSFKRRTWLARSTYEPMYTAMIRAHIFTNSATTGTLAILWHSINTTKAHTQLRPWCWFLGLHTPPTDAPKAPHDQSLRSGSLSIISDSPPLAVRAPSSGSSLRPAPGSDTRVTTRSTQTKPNTGRDAGPLDRPRSRPKLSPAVTQQQKSNASCGEHPRNPAARKAFTVKCDS